MSSCWSPIRAFEFSKETRLRQPFPTPKPPFANQATEHNQKYQRLIPQRHRPRLDDRHRLTLKLRHEVVEFVGLNNFSAGLLGKFAQQLAIDARSLKFLDSRFVNPAGDISSQFLTVAGRCLCLDRPRPCFLLHKDGGVNTRLVQRGFGIQDNVIRYCFLQSRVRGRLR